MNMRNLWPSIELPDPGALIRDLERMIDAVSRQDVTGSWRGVFPPVNVSRDEERYYVRAVVPGIEPSKLQVNVERSKVTISGERSLEGESRDGRSHHRQERTEGSFSRTITLDTVFDSDAVEATYRDGILTIALPLSSAAKARQVPVKTA